MYRCVNLAAPSFDTLCLTLLVGVVSSSSSSKITVVSSPRSEHACSARCVRLRGWYM